MKKVFIAIPNPGHIVNKLAINLLAWTHDPRYTVKVFLPDYISPLTAARNFCVREFLKSDFDYLWWIDDDIIPPPETMDKLITADKDAIGAVCFSMKNDNGRYFPYPVTLRWNNEKKYQVYYGKGIEKVDATGGACVMVKREVYEDIERPYEDEFYRDGTLALTGDFKVWQKAKAKGFQLWVDFDILCSHHREVDIKEIQNYLAEIKNG